MAKVVGPLMSLEARGKIGDALVAFVWKGRNVMRSWTIPSNPRSEGQKIIRQKLASMGKNTLKIREVQTGLPSGSSMYQLVKAVTPAAQIWNAYFAKAGLDDLKTELTFTTLWDAITSCEFALTEFQLRAGELGFTPLTGISYATEIPPEIQLAMGAYAAYKLSLSGTTSLYDTYPSNWTTQQIEDFATDYFTDT